MDKNVWKILKISRMGHKKNLNSGLYLKILMPVTNPQPPPPTQPSDFDDYTIPG